MGHGRILGGGTPKILGERDGPCIRPQYLEKYCYRKCEEKKQTKFLCVKRQKKGDD